MGKLLDAAFKLMATLAGLLLLFITFSIGYSILARQTGLPVPIWVVQINEYALLWLTFLVAGWVLSHNRHVSVQILAMRLGAKSRKILEIIHCIMGIAVCGLIFAYGVYTTYDHFARGIMDIGAVDVSKGWILVIIPVGFGGLTLQFIRNLYLTLTTGETAEDRAQRNEGQDGDHGDSAGAQAEG